MEAILQAAKGRCEVQEYEMVSSAFMVNSRLPLRLFCHISTGTWRMFSMLHESILLVARPDLAVCCVDVYC